MKKWRYREFCEMSDGKLLERSSSLIVNKDSLGREGWELVSVTDDENGIVTFYFKREVEDE